MTPAEATLELLGGQETVRAYLRGLEEGSEADADARRAMLAAIGAAEAAGIQPVMARHEPYLYGQYCLLLCRLWADAEDGAEPAITRQAHSLCLQLRNDPRNQ